MQNEGLVSMSSELTPIFTLGWKIPAHTGSTYHTEDYASVETMQLCMYTRFLPDFGVGHKGGKKQLPELLLKARVEQVARMRIYAWTKCSYQSPVPGRTGIPGTDRARAHLGSPAMAPAQVCGPKYV